MTQTQNSPQVSSFLKTVFWVGTIATIYFIGQLILEFLRTPVTGSSVYQNSPPLEYFYKYNLNRINFWPGFVAIVLFSVCSYRASVLDRITKIGIYLLGLLLLILGPLLSLFFLMVEDNGRLWMVIDLFVTIVPLIVLAKLLFAFNRQNQKRFLQTMIVAVVVSFGLKVMFFLGNISIM